MNRPRGDERLPRNTTDVPNVEFQRKRIAVLLRRDGDSYVLLVAERMSFIVDYQPRALTVFAQFERIRAPDDVSPFRLHLLVSLAWMRLGRGGSFPLIGVDSSVVLVETFGDRMEGIRVCHPVEIVRNRPVLTLVSDEIALLQA